MYESEKMKTHPLWIDTIRIVNHLFSVTCFVVVDMDTTEEAVVLSTTEVAEPNDDITYEKPTSKRQLKLQKRREEWLSRKAERR